MIETWRRLSGLRVEDRRLLLEAVALLAVTRIGLRVMPLAAVRRLLVPSAGRWPGGPADGGPRTGLSADPIRRSAGGAGGRVERVSWAITAASRRLPGTTSCLAQALVAERMLRRRGHTPELRIGVRHGPMPQSERRSALRKAPLDAHAWVECDGVVVVGQRADLADYGVLSAGRRA
ncbi:MAG: lasso peptide biosynthesis B2 protein [Gemmatimonadetes bacterium]|nr:lasso peptide biosynthesis B2 protein [Gemmatimonadota bacterium]